MCVFGRQSSYPKGLGWGSKPKSSHAAGSHFSSQSIERELAHVKGVNDELKTRLEIVKEESNRKYEGSTLIATRLAIWKNKRVICKNRLDRWKK